MPDNSPPLHQRLYRILVAAGKEFGGDKANRLAAALAYYTLFSLVPFLFLTVAVVGYVYEDSVLTLTPCGLAQTDIIPVDSANPLDQLILQVEDVAGGDVANELAQLTCQAADFRQGFLLIGIGLAAFSGSSIFLHVQGVLNRLFHVDDEKVSGITAVVRQRAVALVAALILSFFVLIPLVAVAAVNFIRNLIDVAWIRRTLSVGVPLTSLAMLIAVVTFTFRWLTRAEVPWQAARRGGLFTALTGLAGAYLVGLYLQIFGGGGALGAVGGAAILLFFFNLMWIIYLFGAEVTKVYADFLAHGDVMAPSERSRAPALRPDDADESPPLQPESRWHGGVMAFLIGLVTGWVARRRQT